MIRGLVTPFKNPSLGKFTLICFDGGGVVVVGGGGGGGGGEGGGRRGGGCCGGGGGWWWCGLTGQGGWGGWWSAPPDLNDCPPPFGKLSL